MDPFNIGFKAFFGVITGIGTLVLTFFLIREIDSRIDNYRWEQQRKIELENLKKRRKLKLKRELKRKKQLENFANDAREDFI